MRIPFDIKFRPQIESGEYKIVTGDDRPVRIISWDKKAYGGRCDIVALVPESQGDTETVQLYYPNGALLSLSHNEKFKLFIVTPEPELTEFEQSIKDRFFFGELAIEESGIKEIAAELLTIAREQLQPEIDAEIEKAYKTADEVQYRKGREEALKDLPRWKKDNSFETEGTFIGLKGKECFVVKDGYSVPVTELLTKLPGFKEDE